MKEIHFDLLLLFYISLTCKSNSNFDTHTYNKSRVIKCFYQRLNPSLSRSLCLHSVSASASALVYFNHSHCSALAPHGAGTIVAWGPRLIIVYRTLMKSPKAHAVIYTCMYICVCSYSYMFVCIYLYICLRQDINSNLYTIKCRDAWSTCDKQREKREMEMEKGKWMNGGIVEWDDPLLSTDSTDADWFE